MQRYEGSQPNILFIMADQWRFDFAGFMGADFVATPHLDALAARGMVFEQCGTTSPVCSPARISLASGLYPERMGAVENAAFLPRHCTTYYQRLRDAGYEVGCVGKLDLAKKMGYNGIRGQRPATYLWGFTDPLECEGKMHAGTSPEPMGPYGTWLQEQGLYQAFHEDYRRRQGNWSAANEDSVLPEDAFEDAFIGRQACDWLERRTGEYPWHLFVNFVGPHDPYDPPTAYGERYRQAPMPPAAAIPDDGRPPHVSRRMRDIGCEATITSRRQYCAAITKIDEQIGTILATLERRGEADRTYIVFASDHGDMMGDLGLWTKSVPYEPSVRVPLVVAGPGISAGRSDALVSLFDCNPTICDWAGLPPQADIDARSFAAVARGEEREHRHLLMAQIRAFRCMRTREELFVHHNTQDFEYYDLTSDPHCQHNRIATLSRERRWELIRAIGDETNQGGWCR